MTNIDTIENVPSINMTDSAFQNISERIHDAGDALYTTSKEKYEQKVTLIENAEDMTTKEKLDALDQSYDRHSQEVWQGIIIIGLFSLTLIGIATGSPAIIKNVRRLVA